MSEKKYIKEHKLRDASSSELDKRVAELKAAEYQLRFDRATGKEENYRKVRQNRRQLAAVFTLMRQKELAAGKGGK